jgi:type IV pilus secretin PilQ/predicted competence protein
MVNPKNGWLYKGIRSAMATFVVTIGVLGCATPDAPMGASESSAVQAIGDVTVSREGDDSIVRLEGLADPVYSVTTPGEENVVVVDLVGVGGSTSGSTIGMPRQVAAYDGVVDLVTVSTFDDEGEMPLTRVEIVLAEGGTAKVDSTGDALEIRIESEPLALGSFEADEAASSDAGTTSELSEMDSWQDETLAGVEGEDLAASPGTFAEPPPAATTLTGVRTRTTDQGVLVGLEADGSIGAVEAFTLENPARLVVDLPGLVAAEKARGASVDSGYVTGVRVGAHDGKVRVVLDGGDAAGDFSGRQIMPGTTGLWIAVGGGEALAQAMSSALDEADAAWLAQAARVTEPDSIEVAVEAETTAEPGSLALGGETSPGESVAAIEVEDWAAESEPMEPAPAALDTSDEAAFVAIVDEVEAGDDADTSLVAVDETNEEPSEATAPAPSRDVAPIEVYGLHYERANGVDRTAILSDDSVTYTTSSPDPTTLVVSIPHAHISEEASDRIFPKAGGPVSLIHAFQQPEVEIPEVRVVFTRAPGQAPRMERRGSMLFIEFEDLGVAAAPPPAFPEVGGAVETSETQVAAVTPGTPGATKILDPSDPEAIDSSRGAKTSLAVDEPMPAVDPSTGEVVSMAAAPGLSGMEADPMMGAMALPAETWVGPKSPAAVEVPAAIEVLEEGGLIDGKEYRGRRVSLDFKDVAIADVLRLIAEVSDLNIIAGDEVSGDVTIRLVEVPWDQALDVILMTKGLGFVRVGNVLRIAPADVLKAEEEVRLQERRNKEKLEDLEVKLLPVNYAAVRDTEGLVKRLLSARGTVNLDERTNTLIIKDISSVIDEATALIAAIDTQTPQVMIEAKIVEANLDFSRELGSVWGVQTQQFVDPFDPDTPRRDLGSEDLTFIGDNSLAFANPITAVPTGLMTVGALILDQDFRVDAQIQAAESTGDGKVVSSPRIVTLDNKEARIEQGVSIPFQTFEGGDAKLEFIDAVLSLVVTPHITADKSIIMEILVTRNAPDGTVPTPTGSPAIARNVAETETLVKDGQTLVLGGIYTIAKSQTQSRIPYLHRIPVIGNAFKSNKVQDSRKELLVFVTPRIVQLPEMAAN